MTETIELADGRRLAYAEYGDPAGRAVLYFHGVPGSRLDPEAYREPGARIVAVDRPGFGASGHLPGRRLLDWPADVAALADTLGLDRFAVAGYSSGGKYALACAHALPDRVETAAVVAGVGPPDTPGFRGGLSRTRPVALAYWRLARALVNGRPRLFLAAFERELSEPDRKALADPDLRSSVVATTREALLPGVRGVVQDQAIQARPWGFRLEEIEVPVRFWHGDCDRVVPLRHSEHAASLIPDAELTTLAGEGHLLAGRLPEIAAELSRAGSPGRP